MDMVYFEMSEVALKVLLEFYSPSSRLAERAAASFSIVGFNSLLCSFHILFSVITK